MKLTLVSFSAAGRRISVFAKLEVVDGKAIVPDDLRNKILEKLWVSRGDTYSS